VLRKKLGLRGEKYQDTGANYKIRSFIICTFNQTICDKMEDDEMGLTCGMCGKEEKCIQSVGAEK
jgi:hypothetical protein